jgi:hypothetical protein
MTRMQQRRMLASEEVVQTEREFSRLRRAEVLFSPERLSIDFLFSDVVHLTKMIGGNSIYIKIIKAGGWAIAKSLCGDAGGAVH